MTAVNGAPVLVLVAIVVVIALARPLLAWTDGPRTAANRVGHAPCPMCGCVDATPVRSLNPDPSTLAPALWLCRRCATAYPHLTGDRARDAEARVLAARVNGGDVA